MVQGKYSENDTTNWTPELSRTLNYDLTQARQVDNGEREVERDLTSEPIERDLTSREEVERDLTSEPIDPFVCTTGVFWIDWKSLQTFYDVIYINWNPALFKHKSTIHE